MKHSLQKVPEKTILPWPHLLEQMCTSLEGDIALKEEAPMRKKYQPNSRKVNSQNPRKGVALVVRRFNGYKERKSWSEEG